MNTGPSVFSTLDHVSPQAQAQNPPTPLRQVSPDVLECRTGGGVLTVIGVPFMAAGVFIVLAGLGIVPFRNASDIPLWAYPIVLLFGLIFGGVGAVLVFGRTWIAIDRSRGTVEKCMGLAVPMRREHWRVAEFNLVALQRTTGDSDSADTYPVSLQGGSRTLILNSPVDYALAYRQATYLAEFLRLPFEDTTTGEKRRLEVADLGTSYQERLRHDESRASRVGRPLVMQSTVEEGNGELRITIPAGSRSIWRSLPALIPLAIALYFLPPLNEFLTSAPTRNETEMWFYILLATFLGFFFVVLPLLSVTRGLLTARLGYSRLIVSSRELVFEQRAISRKKRKAIPLVEVVDVDFRNLKAAMVQAQDTVRTAYAQRHPTQVMSPDAQSRVTKVVSWLGKLAVSEGIILKTKTGLFTFGAGLPEDEVAYLTGLVRERIRRA